MSRFSPYPSKNAKHYRLQLGKFMIQTSSDEIMQITIAWLLVSAAFAIVRAGGSISFMLSSSFPIFLLLSAVTVGVGFFFHELSHKVVAQHYHCWAEFRADIPMLLLALAMSFFGFVFIAPGAVIIIGNVTKKQSGIISLAGPAMNFILAILFLAAAAWGGATGWVAQAIGTGFFVNAWLGLFNMIPFWIFDGAKIWRWNKAAYFTTVIALGALLFIGSFLPSPLL